MTVTFLVSEYVHVAYQIKGNEANNIMLANIMLLNLPLTPGVGQTVHQLE